MRPVALALLALALPASAAGPAAVRLLSLDKSSARIAVTLDAPAPVSIAWGDWPMSWTATVDSPAPATSHELLVDKLVPDRQVFYQVLVNGEPASDVLTFRSGRSWVTRRATLLATGATSASAAGATELAARLAAGESDALLVLGGDAGEPGSTQLLHARSATDRVVVDVGSGSDRVSPGLLVVADVAVAVTGDAALVAADGSPSSTLAWASSALPSVQGSCWKILATSREIPAGSAEAAALQGQAAALGIDLVLCRASEASIARSGEVAWIRLPSSGLGHARVHAEEGRLEATLHDGSGASVGDVSAARECAVPRLHDTGPAAHDSGDGDEPGSSSLDADGLAEDCGSK